jgi:uncharacterized membrane protein YbhN (UPF0104 family)
VRTRRTLVALLKVALTVLVSVFIVRSVGIDLEALRTMEAGGWSPAPLPLVGSVLVLLLGYAWSATLWGRMVRELGGPSLPRRTSVPLFLVANLGRYVPGKVLQIAGLTFLARERGVPPGIAAGAAVLGQAVAILGATLVGVAAFLSPALPASIRIWGWIGLGLVGVFVAATSVPGILTRLERIAFALARRVRRMKPGGEEEVHARDSADPPLVPRNFGVRWTLLYAMNWGLYATAFWLLFVGLQGFTPFLYVAPAFAASYVGGYLALFAPAGIGVREGLLVAFLAPVMEAEPALALAVVTRIWSTAVEVIPAAALAPRVLKGRDGDPQPGERRAETEGVDG